MTDTAETFRVVVNDEGQYSIWPADREAPPGWHSAGVSGTREVCLDYIERTWVDMRPRSLAASPSSAPTD